MKVEKLNLELLPLNIIVHFETDYYGLLASEEATVIIINLVLLGL